MNNNIKDFEIFGVTGYTVMSTYHLRDTNLSLKAKGLLSMMISLPKDWDYSISGLVKISKEGKASIRNILDELKQAEYVKINPYRDENGHFRYKYSVYYLPYSKWLEISNSPNTSFRYTGERDTVEPNTDNQTQLKIDKLKNNNKIDKIDKTNSLNVNHNSLTKELINSEYISEDDSSSFYFDDLFDELLNNGHSFRDLSIITHYIVNKVKDRKFLDENDTPIKNKFGYFKYSILSNINKFENTPDNLYEDYDWLNDVEEKEDDFYI